MEYMYQSVDLLLHGNPVRGVIQLVDGRINPPGNIAMNSEFALHGLIGGSVEGEHYICITEIATSAETRFNVTQQVRNGGSLTLTLRAIDAEEVVTLTLSPVLTR